MRTALLRILFLSFVIMAPTLAHAGIGFLFEQTHTIPGLAGNIIGVRFGLYDNDSIPELIATDGHTVVIYSMTGDSVIFQRLVAADPAICQTAALADVNRDGIVDIACGVNDFSAGYFSATVYDGASGFNDTATVSLPHYYSAVGGCISVWGNMQVIDLNGDSNMELLLSADEMGGGFLTESSFGTATLYYSFPDSMIWHIAAPLVSVAPINLADNSRHLWGITRRCYFSELGGDTEPPSYSNGVVSVASYGAIGSFTIGFPNPCEGSTVFEATVKPSFLFSRYVPSMQSQTELFTTSVRTYRCGADTTTIVRKTLNYHLMYSTSTMENIWSIDFPGNLYGMTFIPGLTDYFFAFEGEALLMFHLADGIIRTRLNDVPAGTKSWMTPFTDSIPRLVATHGTTVSLYTLDITTDSPDDGINGQLPISFKLASPYPNPFNAGLTVPLDIPRPGRLKVTVHNLLGQQVAELIDRDTSQGKLALPWDASRFSSGVYFIRATFNDQSATTKALLLK